MMSWQRVESAREKKKREKEACSGVREDYRRTRAGA